MKLPHLLTLLTALVLPTISMRAEDWPQWRGAKRDDISTEKGLLKSWPSGGPKRVWLSDKGGLGYSGFAVAKGVLYTMGIIEGKESVLALDAATGDVKWTAPLSGVYENNWGNGPRSTPTVDGDSLYALTGVGVLAKVAVADGKVGWTVDLQKDLGGKLQNWGYTESVLIDGNNVICTPGGSKGTLAAISKKDGTVVWQTKAITEEAQYSSPISFTHAGQPQIVQLVSKKIFSVNPKDGSLLWETGFPGRVAVIPTLIHHDGAVFATAGYGIGCLQVSIKGKDKVEENFKNNDMVNHHGGVVLVDGYIYGHSDKNGWSCMDWKTGDVKWKSKDLGKGCVTFADGHLYCVDENDGTVALVEASSSGWKEKSRFKLEPQTTQRKKDGRIWTHPVISNGRLYLRDQELISCYDVKGK